MPGKTVTVLAAVLGLGTAGTVAASDHESDTGAARGGAPVVAFIDSGADLNHPLVGPLVDVASKDFVDGDDVPQDANGHGTHTAGIFARIAGRTGARLLVLRVLDEHKAGTAATLGEALDYAIAHGAQIVNMSLNTDVRDARLEAALARTDEAGVLVVTSAGNDGRDLAARPSYPACSEHPNVVAVSTTARFANHGGCVDTLAPGVGIKSAALGGGTVTMDGTSQAAAAVSARAALRLAAQPSLTAAELAATL